MTEASEVERDALDAPSYEALGAAVEAEVAPRLLDRVATWTEWGASTTQAVDAFAVEDVGVEASEWARATGRKPSSVRQSVRRARQAFNEAVEGEGEEGSG